MLGQQEVAGRGDVILKGESGANDPVGIALMASLIAAGGRPSGRSPTSAGSSCSRWWPARAVGGAGGAALLWFMRRVPLPGEGLYPLRTLACSLLLFAVATLAHGSGFLAVFTAGIVLGDARAPYKREVQRFHSALASLAEIVAFVVLDLTIRLDVVSRADVWVPGWSWGRAGVRDPPGRGGAVPGPARLGRGELGFVLFAGLKGPCRSCWAVSRSTPGAPGAQRLCGIIAVAVVAQGNLVPAAARLLRMPMRPVEPEPMGAGGTAAGRALRRAPVHRQGRVARRRPHR